MKTYIFNSIIVALVFVAFAHAQQEDYVQWESYTGKIPDNAVVAGVGDDGNATYVGRVYLNTNPDNNNWDANKDAKGYVPGTIIPGIVSIEVILFQKVVTATTGIEILTKVNNPRLEWKSVKVYEFPKLFDSEEFHLVRAGTEKEGTSFISTTYIGKAQYNDKYNVGKVFNGAQHWAENNYLYFASNNRFVIAYNYYWALVYYY